MIWQQQSLSCLSTIASAKIEATEREQPAQMSLL